LQERVHRLAMPLVLQITAFWVRAILGWARAQ